MLVVSIFFSLLVGVMIGIFPFFVLSWMGRQDLAKKAFLCTAVSAIISAAAAVVVAVGFIIYVILVRDNAGAALVWNGFSIGRTMESPSSRGWKVTCIAGPLRGQTYSIASNGIIIGRDYDCGIRLNPNENSISRHHCSLRQSNGILYLTDLGSRCGTFLSNGSRVYPQQMQPLQNGSVFYLADAQNQFQIIY